MPNVRNGGKEGLKNKYISNHANSGHTHIVKCRHRQIDKLQLHLFHTPFSLHPSLVTNTIYLKKDLSSFNQSLTLCYLFTHNYPPPTFHFTCLYLALSFHHPSHQHPFNTQSISLPSSHASITEVMPEFPYKFLLCTKYCTGHYLGVFSKNICSTK